MQMIWLRLDCADAHSWINRADLPVVCDESHAAGDIGVFVEYAVGEDPLVESQPGGGRNDILLRARTQALAMAISTPEQPISKDPKPRRDRRRENADATRAALCAAGRKLFGSRGYEATSVGELCAEAGVTTGALYHHYRDKKGLFAAVAEQLDAGLVRLAQSARAKSMAVDPDPWAAFLASVDAFLRAGQDPGGRRIGLTDAPAVLGSQHWLEIRERHGLGAMIATVTALQQARVLIAGDPARLARMILGVLYGAVEALPSAEGEGAESAIAEVRGTTHRLLAGLRRDVQI